MCHSPGDPTGLDALPRSISLAYLVAEARRREPNISPTAAAQVDGDDDDGGDPHLGYSASLKIISNHRKPLGLLTVSCATGKNRTLLIPVADRSGSMGGSPTQQVQYSLQRVVDLTYQNSHLITSIVHYDDTASTLHILPDSFSADSYKQQIAQIHARGGTVFKVAFREVLGIIRQHKDDPLMSSICVVFLTDGQDSCSDRQGLVDELRRDVNELWDGPFTIHTVGFGLYHDFAFLDALRKAGTAEGAYRFADPSEDLDSLSNKINSVLDVVATDIVNPIQVKRLPDGCHLIAGANGRYWITGDDLATAMDTVMLTISPAGDGSDSEVINVPVEIDPDHNDDQVIASWHTHLLDEISEELIPLSTQAPALDRDLHLQLLEQRCRAIEVRLGVDDEKNRERLASVKGILDALASAEGVSQQKLQDLKFEGRFATKKSTPRAIVSSSFSAPLNALPAQQRRGPSTNWKVISMPSSRRLKNDDTAFWKVLGSSKNAAIVDFLDQNPDEKQRLDARERTPLMMAASVGRIFIVLGLLKGNAALDTINNEDKEGYTACDLAVLYGYYRTAELLIAAGGLCKQPGDLLLRTCLSRNLYNTASLLLKNKVAQIFDEMLDHAPTNEVFLWLSARQDKEITIENAVGKGLLDIVLERLPSLPASSISWQFHYNIFKNPTPDHVKIVEALLREGKASAHEVLAIDDEDDNEWAGMGTTTPLFLASEKGQTKLVPIITEHLGDSTSDCINWRNHKGTTALWIASCNRHIDVTERLLNLGADCNIPNLVGDGPLVPACQKGNSMIVELLVNCGARLDVYNPERDNPILICCRHNQAAILETLFQSCTYEERQRYLVRYAEIDGFPPLHAATELGHHACLPVLDNFGADLEWRTADDNKILPGATALHLACYYGRLPALQTLISLGADVATKTCVGGFSALHLAVRQGHRSLIEYLLSHEEAKALVTSTDADGRMPSYYASTELNERFFVDRFARSLSKLLSADAEMEGRCALVLLNHGQSRGCFEYSDITGVRFEDNSDLLSWTYLLGTRNLTETLHQMGADLDLTDDLQVSARFWKEYFHPGLGDAIPANVQIMLDRVSSAKGLSLQNRTLLSVKPGVKTDAASQNRDNNLMEKMNDGFGSDCRQVAKLEGPPSLLGFLAKLGKSKEVTEVDFMLWDAKINAVKRIAAGLTGPLSAIHIIALYLYTGYPEVFRKANAVLHSQPSPTSLWPPFVQCLYQGLELLPTWQGEAYRAVESAFSAEMYRVGEVVTWDAFSLCTQEWRKVTHQLDRRSGIVFIIQSRSAREVHPYSRYAADREIVFLPETKFVVENYYNPDILCLGQANIRGSTFAVSEKDIANATRGTACIVVELREGAAATPLLDR